MSSPSFPLSPLHESDITFTSIQSVLFDSPCSWRDADSSDSGFGSSDSESEVRLTSYYGYEREVKNTFNGL